MSANDEILDLTGIGDTGSMVETLELRSNIFEMTEAAEEAVLRPKDAGRWPHALRAALAARIANLNGSGELARRYAIGAGEYAPLAEANRDGVAEGLGPVIAHIDKVATRTRDVVAADIVALQDAGVDDADIVRLCELNAFLAFKIRVVAGLRLMAGPNK